MKTNAQLTQEYNEVSGKNVKSGSFSKSELKKLIEKYTNTVRIVDIAASSGLDAKTLRARARRNRNKLVRFEKSKHEYFGVHMPQVEKILGF